MLGTTTVSSELHPKKVESGIEVMPLGKLTETKETVSLKQLSTMLPPETVKAVRVDGISPHSKEKEVDSEEEVPMKGSVSDSMGVL